MHNKVKQAKSPIPRTVRSRSPEVQPRYESKDKKRSRAGSDRGEMSMEQFEDELMANTTHANSRLVASGKHRGSRSHDTDKPEVDASVDEEADAWEMQRKQAMKEDLERRLKEAGERLEVIRKRSGYRQANGGDDDERATTAAIEPHTSPGIAAADSVKKRQSTRQHTDSARGESVDRRSASRSVSADRGHSGQRESRQHHDDSTHDRNKER